MLWTVVSFDVLSMVSEMLVLLRVNNQSTLWSRGPWRPLPFSVPRGFFLSCSWFKGTLFSNTCALFTWPYIMLLLVLC